MLNSKNSYEWDEALPLEFLMVKFVVFYAGLTFQQQSFSSLTIAKPMPSQDIIISFVPFR